MHSIARRVETLLNYSKNQMQKQQAQENEEVDDAHQKHLSTEQLRALLKRSREENSALQASLAEEKALVEGTFYLRIDELFEPVLIIGRDRLTENHYRNCCRNGNVNLHDVYQATVAAARKEENIPADDPASRSRSSMSRQTTNSIWPCTVFDPNSQEKEIAHLVPASVRHANSYWFVTDFLFGFDPDRSWKERRCLIHGSKPQKNGAKRCENSGIKHLVPNKINLPGQKYMDAHPCVVIVPILTVEQVKAWNGGPYDAIALIDKHPDEDILFSAEDVATSTKFFKRGEQASPEEIKKAGDLLQAYVEAILFAQIEKKPIELTTFTFAWAKQDEPDHPSGFFLPQIQQETGSNPQKPVRKVHFVDHSSTDIGHPSPDPLLLVSRVAVVWSRRHQQHLVAAEPTDDADNDYGEEWDELDELAAEQYLNWREQQQQQSANLKPIVGLTIDIGSKSPGAPGLIHE
jgi:hypothetical protein